MYNIMKKLFISGIIILGIIEFGHAYEYYGKYGGQSVSTITYTKDTRLNGNFEISNPTGSVHLKFSTNAVLSTETKEQIQISTNVYIVGYSSANAYYGDGSNLTDTKWNEISLNPASLTAGDLIRYDGSDFVRIASGTTAGQYLKQDYTWDTPAGAGDVLEAGDNTFTGYNTFSGSSTTFVAGSTVAVLGYLAGEQSIKAWIVFDMSGAGSIIDSYNVTSITDVNVGIWTVTWAVDFANTSYVTIGNATGGNFIAVDTHAVGSCRVLCLDHAGNFADDTRVSFMAIGDR